MSKFAPHKLIPNLSLSQVPSGGGRPLGPLGYNISKHSPTTRSEVERTARKEKMLSDRVWLPSAEARVEGIKGGSAGVFVRVSPDRPLSSHTPNPSQPL